MFAVLGDITFEVLRSPESFESVSASSYAEHKTVESTPKLQWVGDELETLALEIQLHVNFANPAADLAALEAARKAHRAMALVFGSGYHAGYFVITKIAKSLQQLAADGSLIAIKLKLELKEWALSVEVDPTAPPQPDFTPPGVIIGSLQPGESVAGVVGPTGTVTLPSGQAGVSPLVNNPAAPGAPAPGADPDLVPLTTITRADPSVVQLA